MIMNIDNLPSLEELTIRSSQLGSDALAAYAQRYVAAYKSLQSKAVQGGQNIDLHDRAQQYLDESAAITSLAVETKIMEIYDDPNASENERRWAKEQADQIKNDILEDTQRTTSPDHRAIEPKRYR